MREIKPVLSSRACTCISPTAISMPWACNSAMPLPRYFGIGVLHGSHHSDDTGINQGIGAWRRAAVMTARLQRDVDGCIFGLVSGLLQGMDFCMCA